MTTTRLDDYRPRIESEVRRIERELIQSLEKLPKPARPEDARHIIREKVLEVQKIGSGYAAEFFHVQNFYAAEDFSEIGRLVDDVYRTFAYGGSVKSAAITLTSVMLAKATVNKARQIFSRYVEVRLGAIMRIKSMEQYVDVPDPEDEPMIEDLAPPELQTGLWFVWRTMGDALVCPICDALDGMEWDFEDPGSDPLTPVEDTHPNCRCRVDLERRSEFG